MTKEYELCPNCQTKLKGGFLSTTHIIDQYKTDLINEYAEDEHEVFCNKCGFDLYTGASKELTIERNVINSEIQKLLESIPVVSTHSPLNWDYDILAMVTGQSTTGTGVISEFTSSFSDLFGMQSNRYNEKLKRGERMCFAQLRLQALDLGGNAVLATDIDYSEVGGDKGMLMVCMGGTAVRLKNAGILGEERNNGIKSIIELRTRLKHLSSYKAETI